MTEKGCVFQGTSRRRDFGTSGYCGRCPHFFCYPADSWSRGLVFSSSRYPVVSQSLSLVVLLSCWNVSQPFSVILSHSQPFSVPSLRNLSDLHSLKSSAAIAEALPRYGGCFLNYARQARPPNIAIEECDYSPIISKILIAAVATGVPGPKIAAAPS